MLMNLFSSLAVKAKSFSLAKLFLPFVTGTVVLDKWQNGKTVDFGGTGGGLESLNQFSEKYSQWIANGWDAVSHMFGNQDAGGKILKFYLNWQDYLHPSHAGLIIILGTIKELVLGALYYLTRVLAYVMMAMLHIFGVIGDWMISKSNPLHILFFAVLGIALLFLILYIIRFAYGMMAGEKSYKLPLMVKNIINTTFLLVGLPIAFSMMMGVIENGSQGLFSIGQEAVGVSSDKQSKDNGLGSGVDQLALMPITQNTTDLSMTARQGFKYKPFKDGPYANKPINQIPALGMPNFTDIMDSEMIKLLNGKVNEEGDKKNNGIGDVFKYRLLHLDSGDANAETFEGKSGYTLDNFDVKEGITHVFDKQYARYQTHGWIILLEYLVLDAVLISMAFRIAFTAKSLIADTIVAPLTAQRDLRSSDQIKKTYSRFIGAGYSIFGMIVLFFVFWYIVTHLPEAINEWIGKATDLGSFGQAIARGISAIIIYASAGLMLVQGANSLDKATGYESGHLASLTSASGLIGGGLMLGGFAKQLGSGATKGLVNKFGDNSSQNNNQEDNLTGGGSNSGNTQNNNQTTDNQGADASGLEGTPNGASTQNDGDGDTNVTEEQNQQGDENNQNGDSFENENVLDGQEEASGTGEADQGGSIENQAGGENDLGNVSDDIGESQANEASADTGLDNLNGEVNSGTDMSGLDNNNDNQGKDASFDTSNQQNNTSMNDIAGDNNSSVKNTSNTVRQPTNQQISQQINQLAQQQQQGNQLNKKQSRKTRNSTRINRLIGLGNQINRPNDGDLGRPDDY